jgi:hypothetical protein
VVLGQGGHLGVVDHVDGAWRLGQRVGDEQGETWRVVARDRGGAQVPR